MSGTERQPGLVPLVRELLAYPLPRGVGWPQVFGSLLLVSFAVQLVTGVLLALYYSPSATDAWESVRYIETEVRAGGLVRSLHHFGSSSFVILLVLHVLRTFVWGAYKGERRWTWVVGALLFACVLGFGFTGYLLPWDLRAFFGTRVGVEIAASVPVVGEAVKELLAGGASVGALTLPRFYALHVVVLPLVTVALVALHLTLLRVHGITPSWRGAGGTTDRTFWPHQVAKDLGVGLLLVLALLAVASAFDAPLGEKADPQNTDYVPRPEWYFLGLQQLLRVFQGEWEVLGSFVIPAAGAMVFVALPWLDRNPERAPSRRPIAMGLAALTVGALVVLTVQGEAELAREEREMAARIAAEREEAEPSEPDVPQAEPELSEAELVTRGRRLYNALACDGCHGEASASTGSPLLDHEGSKVRRDWLRDYLVEPTRIRFETEGVHPLIRMPDYRLDEVELESLVAFLMSLRDEELVPERDLAGPSTPELVAEGRVLVEEYDCLGCHVLAGEGEAVGPNFDRVGARLTTGWMKALLLDPEGVVPGTSMMDFLLDEAEAEAMARFLETLR